MHTPQYLIAVLMAVFLTRKMAKKRTRAPHSSISRFFVRNIFKCILSNASLSFIVLLEC